jgi:hypothetical protein
MNRHVVNARIPVLIAALVLFAGCGLDKPTGAQIDRDGEFSVTSTELGDTAMAGIAIYGTTRENGIATLIVTFLGRAPGFSIALSGPGLPVTTEGLQVGVGDDQFGGALTITRAQGPETYLLTSGSLSFTRTSLGELTGIINFTATQTAGPQPDRVIRGSGTFRATCPDECLVGTS